MIISHSDMMFYGLFLVIARFVKGSDMDTMIKRKMLYAGMLLLCAAMLVFCMTDRVHAADNTAHSMHKALICHAGRPLCGKRKKQEPFCEKAHFNACPRPSPGIHIGIAPARATFRRAAPLPT